jgi:hypothetical protein
VQEVEMEVMVKQMEMEVEAEEDNALLRSMPPSTALPGQEVRNIT